MLFNDIDPIAPPLWHAIAKRTEEIDFDMPSDLTTGALLRILVGSKPGGTFLELGTGTGLATTFMLDGMDSNSSLVSVDNSERCQAIARDVLANDARVMFELTDGSAFISRQPVNTFDLIFADTWPGKYEQLEETLALVKRGGFYVGDDMLPQTNWPDGHGEKVSTLLHEMSLRTGWQTLAMDWSSGIVLSVRRE